jgi:hypothetical protein
MGVLGTNRLVHLGDHPLPRIQHPMPDVQAALNAHLESRSRMGMAREDVVWRHAKDGVALPPDPNDRMTVPGGRDRAAGVNLMHPTIDRICQLPVDLGNGVTVG